MEKEIKIDVIWYLLDIDEQEAIVIKSQDKEYSDKIVIPSFFFHEGITYRVTRIGEQAFQFCSKLYSITIPDSVIKVESKAFEGCWELAEVHVNSIEDWCKIEFSGPYSNPLVNSWKESYGRNITNLCIKGEVISELIIPSTVKVVKDYTFSFCEGLTSITILDGVTHIGEGAFIYCTNIKHVTIPNSVISIGERAFEYCINLTTIDISNGVINIGNSAFDRCHKLVSIIGGTNLKCIGNSAFNECENLSSFDISNNVEIIGNCAFYGCHSLGVIIPQNLVSIGRYAFYKCWLDSITIPKNLTNIDKCAFKGCHYDCENLEIIVDESNPKYDSRENCNAIIETKSNTLIIGCDTTKIPNSVTSIGDEAFSDWSTLYSITIPHGVRSIGKGAFAQCYKLCSATIPETVLTIDGAFSNCYQLGSVHIDSLESWCKIDFCTYSPFARMNQYNIRTLHINKKIIDRLEIPNSITEIKNHAFEGFYLKSVIIPKSVKIIGDWSFCGTHGFESIIIPNSVKFIGEGAFQDCYLTSAILPKSMEYIGKRAFSFCTNMTYITILGNPTIMDEAFKKCNSIRDLYCYSEEIPKVHNAFEGLDLSLITLHVPTDVIENYRNIEPWCKFGSIVSLK